MSFSLKLFLFFFASTFICVAQQNTFDTIEEEIIEEDTRFKLPFEVSGFVDGYYQYNFNETGFGTSFTDRHNTFALGMANVVLSREGKVGFVADLAFGPRATAANGLWNDDPTLSAIKQLFITYTPADFLTLTFGNFSTFVGYELIDSPGNVNYSTSYLFSNGPFFHTGLKADFTLNENFGAMIGVFNDTDDKFDEISGKHLGAQLSANVGEFSGYLNFIAGKDGEIINADGETENINEYEIDLTATYQASDDIMIGLNVANYGSASKSFDTGGFMGAALYLTFAASETFDLGLRAEHFRTRNGYFNEEDPSVTALTASGNIKIGNLTIIPEFRADLASSDYFSKDGEARNNQLGVLVGAVYSF